MTTVVRRPTAPQLLRGAAPFLFPGGPRGCLLLHGFTAAPQEVLRLGAHLANSGFTALGVRVAGHGTRLADLARTRWTDWLASAEDGYAWLQSACDQIVVMGVSMGGLLALLLACEHPIDGLVLMSTPMTVPRAPLGRLLRPLSAVYPSIPKGPPHWFDPAAAQERVAYRAYPTRSLVELRELIVQARARLPQIRVPALMIHSRRDTFVPPANSEIVMAGLGSRDKRLLLVERSNHTITLDSEREAVFHAAADFARRVSEASR